MFGTRVYKFVIAFFFFFQTLLIKTLNKKLRVVYETSGSSVRNLKVVEGRVGEWCVVGGDDWSVVGRVGRDYWSMVGRDDWSMVGRVGRVDWSVVSQSVRVWVGDCNRNKKVSSVKTKLWRSTNHL